MALLHTRQINLALALLAALSLVATTAVAAPPRLTLQMSYPFQNRW